MDLVNVPAHYGDSSWTPLKLAASNGHLEIVEFLVKSGVDVERDGGRYNPGGLLYEPSTTPLFLAASNGHLSVVRFLFENCRADVEKTDTNGDTAVFVAASNGHLDVLKYLLEIAGARQRADRNGCTLLNAACHGLGGNTNSNHLGVVKYLFESGFDQHRQADDRGQTPLFNASSVGRTEIVQYLLEVAKGEIYVDSDNNEGRTALHAAIGSSNQATIQCLVEHGAKVDRVDNDGATALWLAASRGNVVAAEYLIDHGAELNKAANDGNTPLHIAAAGVNRWTTSFPQLVSMLLAFGASLKATNNAGLLPIDVADNDEIRQLIDDEFIRRRDHGYKRAVIPDPIAAEEQEQESKLPRLEGEVGGGGESSSGSGSGSGSSSSGQVTASSTQEEKEKLEEDEDSEPSDEEED